MPADPFAQRYTNLRFVGRGGFGVVYRAWDSEMERDVALKLLNADFAADPDWRRRFRLEATAASKLNHPNITIVFDRGEFEDQPFIVMELVEGETLAKVIERRVPLTDPERLFLLEQLCDGLHYAHQRNVVHRDIKPINLVLREEHDGTHAVRTLKILDFGIAKIANAGQTASGAHMFTPNYVSPEQIRGEEVNGRSDMFAVGAVAYELLSHEKAFVIDSKDPFTLLNEVKRKIEEEPHRPLLAVRPDIDPELSGVVDRALAKRPEDRFKDLADMRRALRRIRDRLEESLHEDLRTTIVLPRTKADPVRPATEVTAAVVPPPPAPPAVVASPPAREPERARWTLMRVAVPLALLLILAAAGYWKWAALQRPVDTAPSDQAAGSAVKPAADPAGPDAQRMGTTPVDVTIVATPWARFTVTPAVRDSKQNPLSGMTPARVQLLPGDYTVELDGGSAGRMTERITVGPGSGVRSFRMPEFNADSVVRATFGPER